MNAISLSCRFAQTNLQLYDQLMELGYAETDLARIAKSYDLASCLFAASFRPSRRSFLAHCVATASILATHGAVVDTISAGMLHAAYTLGDFGTPRFGIKRFKRRHLKNAVGAEVESLVATYTSILWNPSTIPSLTARRLDTMSAEEREVMFMRIANEIDESWEFAFYINAIRDERVESLRLCVELARRLGGPDLAHEVDEAYVRLRSRAVPPEFLRSRGGGVFVSPPATYAPRLRSRAALAARAMFRLLPNALIQWTRKIRVRRAYGRIYQEVGR